MPDHLSFQTPVLKHFIYPILFFTENIIEIRSMEGRLCQRIFSSNSDNTLRINTSSLLSGWYLLQTMDPINHTTASTLFLKE